MKHLPSLILLLAGLSGALARAEAPPQAVQSKAVVALRTSAGAESDGTPSAALGRRVTLEIDRFDPALDEIVPPGTQLEKVADGFAFAEGPVWLSDRDGALLFSDIPRNRIHRWSAADGAVSIHRAKSGYSGADAGAYRQPGSNGLTLDAEGRLTICEHGNRRVSRIENDGTLTVLAAAFEGRRFNSPNDLVYRSDGTLFFTDPCFGLPDYDNDPRRELPFAGVYALREGKLAVISRDLKGPNGIALSPDERLLYVGNWEDRHKTVMRYRLNADLSVAETDVFADLTAEPGTAAIDGVKVDTRGNVYVSGPGGIWIFSAGGRRLGRLRAPEHPHNLGWGGRDLRTLYLTAQTGLYRVRLSVPGAGATLRPGP
ncbi:MAG TPA: SMP-30/gluconolactonase/LRE family protein [Opitutaceae bacterium]